MNTKKKQRKMYSKKVRRTKNKLVKTRKYTKVNRSKRVKKTNKYKTKLGGSDQQPVPVPQIPHKLDLELETILDNTITGEKIDNILRDLLNGRFGGKRRTLYKEQLDKLNKLLERSGCIKNINRYRRSSRIFYVGDKFNTTRSIKIYKFINDATTLGPGQSFDILSTANNNRGRTVKLLKILEFPADKLYFKLKGNARIPFALGGTQVTDTEGWVEAGPGLFKKLKHIQAPEPEPNDEALYGNTPATRMAASVDAASEFGGQSGLASSNPDRDELRQRRLDYFQSDD